MKLVILATLFLVGCNTPSGSRVLCRHIVHSQYEWAIDNGYEANIVDFINPEDVRIATGYKYHRACRIRKDGKAWQWLDQPRMKWTSSPVAPRGTIKEIRK